MNTDPRNQQGPLTKRKSGKVNHSEVNFYVGIAALFIISLICLALQFIPASTQKGQQGSSSLSTPPSTQPLTGGSLATVTTNSKTYTFRANDIGLFPRISVAPQAVIKIHLDTKPSEPIQELALDGGGFENNKIAQQQMAGSDGHLDFAFQAANTEGSSRVAILRYGKREIFDFWVDRKMSH